MSEKPQMPRIDPKALYTTDQAAEMMMQIEPELSFEEARRQVQEAIDSGKLKIAGYLSAK